MTIELKVYSVIKNCSIELLLNLLGELNWKIRKSAWNEYECISDFAEMYLINEKLDILFNGTVFSKDDFNDKLLNHLKINKVSFNIEFYRDDLLDEVIHYL